MRRIQLSLSLLAIFFLMFYSGSNFSSCTKKQTVTDTLYKTIQDTTIKTIRDTTVLTDTVYDLTDGLVAYYNFNGGSLNDSSGNNNTITFNNATPAADRFGRVGNAYSFDGATSYMQVANSPSLNPDNSITMMAIIKINAFYAGQCLANQIFGKASTSDNENGFYCLRFTDFNTGCSGNPPNPASEDFNAAYGATSGGGGVISTNLTLELGQWYTVIYTYDGQKSNIWVNGTLVGSNTNVTTFSANSDPLIIGKDGNPALGYYFNGVIDELRIYSRALTTKEVAQLNKVQE